MSAQDDYVKKNLEASPGDADRPAWTRRNSWRGRTRSTRSTRATPSARAIENDEKRTAEERKRAKEVADGIAKAAPAITKSVISAIKAFNKGDAINGAAEIMDICASLAPLISTFLNAAGPEGALVGAFFSVDRPDPAVLRAEGGVRRRQVPEDADRTQGADRAGEHQRRPRRRLGVCQHPARTGGGAAEAVGAARATRTRTIKRAYVEAQRRPTRPGCHNPHSSAARVRRVEGAGVPQGCPRIRTWRCGRPFWASAARRTRTW